MDTIPTAEEMGRTILDIFEQNNVRAGEFLPIRVIQGYAGNEYRSEDFKLGLSWLEENGYVEVQGRGYRLTEKGFAEI